MTTTATCESCGMPIETGRYCGYCTDESGQLQAFEERFERMTAWQARRSPGTPREEIERQTLDYMATMPAWRSAPPIICLRRQASSISSVDPARHAPIGAPSPLLKSIHAVSKPAA